MTSPCRGHWSLTCNLSWPVAALDTAHPSSSL
jgi:hypothetical protein